MSLLESRALRCPCDSGESYAECCGSYHTDRTTPPTAQLLMRSRYSAFAVGDSDYLLRTWHPSTRPATVDLDSTLRWIRLEVEHTERGGLFDGDGVVRFTAHYRDGAERGSQHETSRFVRFNRNWTYLDAIDGRSD
ncbi:YchJ family metal-binding protein [Leifsonia psychrotolerans]